MNEATALHSLATVGYQDHTDSATLASLVLCCTPQGADEASCSGHTTDDHCGDTRRPSYLTSHIPTVYIPTHTAL